MSKGSERAFHVLIPAAGSGTRMGLSTPKQYKRVGGKMILRHTIEKFIGIQGLRSIRVIIDPEHATLYQEAVQGLDLPPPVFGGKTRKQSVYNGLCIFSQVEYEDTILIHDAARPFVTPACVETLLDTMATQIAATLVAPIADTLVDEQTRQTLNREQVRAIQTPQAFHLGFLKKAHEAFRTDERFTDDAGLISALGEQVAFVEGSRDNFKITTREDLVMAERLLARPMETRTGFGYDIHAFDPAPATHIRLGGIDIPHTRKLLGHSDADVILHALTDALLGTIGDGDIGQIFPPSDMQWKGASSDRFVKEALRRVRNAGGRLRHADISLIAEEPKIGPYRAAMQEILATLLGISPSRVGLKATTNEGLGAIGRGEGICAHAVVSVTFPEDGA